MSDLSLIPLQDGFETQLSQDWDGNTGTIYVLATPSYTPTTTNTYIVVNPGKTNMQIAEITDYDSTAKTLTVSSISFEKGLGISSTAQDHSTGSKVIISDNYQFWEDIQTAINTKLDDTGGTMTGLLQFTGTTHAGIKVNSLTTTQRDALTPANGNIIYNTTAGEFQIYQGGAWSTIASGSTQPNASATVAGKVEIATTAESIAGTDTGGTGALLSVLPSDIAKNTQSGVFTYAASADVSDTYTATLVPALTAYATGMRVRILFTTANTGACTLNLNALGAKNIKLIDGTDPLDGDISANTIYDFIYDGTNMVLQSVAVRATSADITAGTSNIKYPTVAQMVSQINANTTIPEQDIPYVTGNVIQNVSTFKFSTNTSGTVAASVYKNAAATNATIQRYAKDTLTGQYILTHETTLIIGVDRLGICLTTNYIYVSFSDAGTYRMRRYDIADLANVTSITVSGTTWANGESTFSDGTDIYIFDSTTSDNASFHKYTISGTTATFSSTVTYTGGGSGTGVVWGATCDGTNVWIVRGTGVPVIINKFSKAGGASTGSATRYIYYTAYDNVGTIQLGIPKSGVLGVGFAHSFYDETAQIGGGYKLMTITQP